MIGRLEAWQDIQRPANAALLAAVAEAAEIGPTLLARLRKRHPRPLVEVAVELVRARRKAVGKFADPAALLADVAGVEQATGARVAAHKAARYAAAPAVVDLCCGIGGDAMALAAVVPEVRVIDRSAERVLMARHNAGVPGEVLEVADFVADGRAWLHVDPARRVEATGRRLWRYEDYEPGPEVLEPLLAAAPAAGVKLGPGVDWSGLPGRAVREVEFISDAGALLQVVLWCGKLCRAPGEHTATRLDGVADLSFTAAPDGGLPVDEEPGRYLLVPDPALERSQLVAPRIAGTDAAELAPGLGLLSCAEPLGDPWFETWEILAVLPWREAGIRSWLRDHDGGLVTVRTRDGAVPTDAAQVALRGAGSTPHTLFGLRLGKRVVCLVTRRCP